MESLSSLRTKIAIFLIPIILEIILSIIAFIFNQIDIRTWIDITLLLFIVFLTLVLILYMIENRKIREQLTTPIDIKSFLEEIMKSPETFRHEELEIGRNSRRMTFSQEQPRTKYELITYSRDQYTTLIYDQKSFRDSMKANDGSLNVNILFNDCSRGLKKVEFQATESPQFYIEIRKSQGQLQPSTINPKKRQLTYELHANSKQKEADRIISVQMILRKKP